MRDKRMFLCFFYSLKKLRKTSRKQCLRWIKQMLLLLPSPYLVLAQRCDKNLTPGIKYTLHLQANFFACSQSCTIHPIRHKGHFTHDALNDVLGFDKQGSKLSRTHSNLSTNAKEEH